ncbi:MAG: hypothetical protein ACI4MK_00220 [Aristaeellaceae bacterium]
MRLSKIKSVCRACKQIRLLTADEFVDNMVTQWIGVDGALYPVTGTLLNLPTLGAVWELGDRLEDWDAAEGRYTEMVERGLLTTLEADVLRRVPLQVDAANMPEIQMGEYNGYLGMAVGPELICYLKEWLLEPCRGMGRLGYDMVSGAGSAQWVAVYAGGTLAGLIRPESEGVAGVISKGLRAMAAREPWGV